jgi:hypothetical protein
MNPAHYQVATVWIMPVLQKVATSIFKFNTNVLPLGASSVQGAFTFAIWKIGSDAFYQETQFSADHSEKVDNSLLIDWGIP